MKRSPISSPFVRSLLSGEELLRSPRFNKSLAFTKAEREALRLRGLLPPAVISPEIQVRRVEGNFRAATNDIAKNTYLMSLYDRNQTLFYKTLEARNNLVEMMPILYTPTVGDVALKLGPTYRGRPRSMTLTIEDKGEVLEVLKNWPARDVRAIVMTDGERVLGLGDLGVNGGSISVGKMILYSAIGGIMPQICLPIALDVGTNNRELLEDELYVGLRRKRATGDEYDSFMDEVMWSINERFGQQTPVLVQFEDFGNKNAARLLDRYKDKYLTYNDDIQGTSSVAVAGVLGALPITGKSLEEHRFLMVGAGSAGCGIARLLARAIAKRTGVSEEQANSQIFMYDANGSLHCKRDDLNEQQKPFARHTQLQESDLEELVDKVKPSAIIGVSGQYGIFTERVVRQMAAQHKRPIVFALSNPTSNCEVGPSDTAEWSEGRAIYASGSPWPQQIEYPDGTSGRCSQGNNSWIFPGVSLGLLAVRASHVPEDAFLVAAEVLSEQLTPEMLARAQVFPPNSQLRKVAVEIGARVAQLCYEEKVALLRPVPEDMRAHCEKVQYRPEYKRYV